MSSFSAKLHDSIFLPLVSVFKHLLKALTLQAVIIFVADTDQISRILMHLQFLFVSQQLYHFVHYFFHRVA